MFLVQFKLQYDERLQFIFYIPQTFNMVCTKFRAGLILAAFGHSHFQISSYPISFPAFLLFCFFASLSPWPANCIS